MKNAIFKALFSITFALLLGTAFLVYKASLKPTMITPYPYIIDPDFKIMGSDLRSAEKSQILIVGDQLGLHLSLFLPILESSFKDQFKTAPSIYNWSKENEGLHRTLYKLKALQKIPSIVIYHSGNSENFEKKFNINESDKIYYNFNLKNNETIESFIFTFPFISKFLFKNIERIVIPGILPKISNNKNITIKEKELSFKIYEEEFQELLNLIKKNKSKLIVITTPLNLLLPPNHSCNETETYTTLILEKEIKEDLDSGNFKLAYQKSLELTKENKIRALGFYYLGIAAKNLSEIKTARESLQLAQIYNCSNEFGNQVYNSLMKKISTKADIQIIKFDETITNLQLTNDGVFMDEQFPQNLNYEQIVNELAQILHQYYKLSK
jgi:hypothetical protein